MVRWRDAAVCLAAQENQGERKIWFVMQADLAVVWEIPVCVSHLYYFMSRSVKKKKRVITVLLLTQLTAVQLSWAWNWDFQRKVSADSGARQPRQPKYLCKWSQWSVGV